MFTFLQSGALNTSVEVLTLSLDSELKPLSQNINLSLFDKSNSMIENFFNTSILLSTDKVIQWRTIENSKTISPQTILLENLINKKDKNFFYRTVYK